MGLRRRALMAESEEEMREWKVLLDKTVDDNSIYYYTVDAQGCKEFYVSVFFTNDAEITAAINGKIAVNASASPWSTGISVSYNIPCLVYSTNGNNNKAIIFGFELVDGIIIPKQNMMSANTSASSHVISGNGNGSLLKINSERTELSYPTVDEIQNVSVGSYAKYFGVGSKILILGR